MNHPARSSWLLVLIAVAGFSPVQAQAYENPADVATIDATNSRRAVWSDCFIMCPLVAVWRRPGGKVKQNPPAG